MFVNEGPGAESTDLDSGLDLMKSNKKIMEKLNATKEDLVTCQKLFNLPITLYPEIRHMEIEMEKLNIIYDI